jgi:hypothetical protein
MRRVSLGRLRVSVAVASACVIFVPVTAHAQFGGLIKKATQSIQSKAQAKVADQTRPAAPGEALTTETFNKVLVGIHASDKVLAQRDQILSARDAQQVELNQLIEANRPVHEKYEAENSRVVECRNKNFEKLSSAFSEEIDRKMKAMQGNPQAVPHMREVALKYAQPIQTAQQKGDTAELIRLTGQMQAELLGVDPREKYKADTVATDAKCGKLPTPPAALVHEDSLRVQIAASGDSIRSLESQAVDAGVTASGLDRMQYLELKERVYTIYLDLSGGHSIYSYGEGEVALVKEHNSELKQMARAL